MKYPLLKRVICLILTIPLVLGIGCLPVFSDDDSHSPKQTYPKESMAAAYSAEDLGTRSDTAEDMVHRCNYIETGKQIMIDEGLSGQQSVRQANAIIKKVMAANAANSEPLKNIQSGARIKKNEITHEKYSVDPGMKLVRPEAGYDTDAIDELIERAGLSLGGISGDDAGQENLYDMYYPAKAGDSSDKERALQIIEAPNSDRMSAEEARALIIEKLKNEMAEYLEGIDSFADDAALQILDTNADGRIDSQDSQYDALLQRYLKEEELRHLKFICDNNKKDGQPIDATGFLDNSTKELLGMALIWAARLCGEDFSIYLSNGWEVSFVADDNGVTRLTISGEDWEVSIEHWCPGVSTETLSDVKNTFKSINPTNILESPITGKDDVTQKTVGDIQSGFDNIRNDNSVRHKIGEVEYDETTEASHNVKSTGIVKSHKTAYVPKNGATSYANMEYQVKNVSNENSENRKRINSQTTQAARPDPGQGCILLDDRELLGTKGIDNDSELLIGSKWLEKKAALSDLFERVLTEEPGAVYLKEKESISAVILIAVAKDKKQEKSEEKNEDAI